MVWPMAVNQLLGQHSVSLWIVEGRRLRREDGPPVVVVAALLHCCLRGGILAVTRKLAKQYKIQ